MPTNHLPNRGILQYWPQILSMVMAVGAAGAFYGKVNNAFTQIENLSARQERQFEEKKALELRVIELEKNTQYYKGLRDGRNEVNQTKKTTE